jgi:hypothetical protein
VTRLQHFLLAAVGLAILALTVGVFSLDPVIAQGGKENRPPLPVVITDAEGNAASVDRQGSIAVQDPRLTFSRAGIRVDTGDHCCPRPSQSIALNAYRSLDNGVTDFPVPQGKAVIIDALSVTGQDPWFDAGLASLGHQGGGYLLAALAQTGEGGVTTHLTFPRGIVFRSGDTVRLSTSAPQALAYGVIVADE